MEDFADRYENVWLLSPNSSFFVPVSRGSARQRWPPFYLNGRCYTVFLIDNSMPNRFREPINEDTDMSLQVLSSGMCTVLINAFTMDTPETMSHTGGQTTNYANDGRLRMARVVERAWPGVVTTRRRFGRPQHAIKGMWKYFTTPLIPAANPPSLRDYGLKLKQRGHLPETMKALFDE